MTLRTTLQDESFFHLQLELSRWITGSFWRTEKAEKNEELDIGEREGGEIPLAERNGKLSIYSFKSTKENQCHRQGRQGQ